MLRLLSLILLAHFALVVDVHAQEQEQEEELPTVEAFGEQFPLELAQKIWDAAFLKPNFFPYRRLTFAETGQVEGSSFIWKYGQTQDDVKLDQLELTYESKLQTTEERKQFKVYVTYKKGQVIVRHSKPSEKKFIHGISTKYQTDRNHEWGGYIFGNEVPGVLFIVAQMKEELAPPVLVCPRFGRPDVEKFVLQGRDPESTFVGVSGKFSGEVSAEFSTGYRPGSIQIDFETLRVAPPFVPEKFVVAKDAETTFGYIPQDVELGATRDESGITPVGFATHFQLTNSAERVKNVTTSQVYWVQEINFEKVGILKIVQKTQLKNVSIQKGLCTLIFPTEYRRIHYPKTESEE